MEMTSPMQSKPLVNATCKLGEKGCYKDGRCHYIGNCVSKKISVPTAKGGASDGT